MVAAVLSACGGGTAAAPEVRVSGAVIDGYLRGAKVCLDTNANAKCDTGEPSDTTKAKGAYSFAASAADVAKYSVVAEVTAATIDEDTNVAVAKPYVLMAPPGAQSATGQVYVTPMTTLMQNAMDLNPNLKLGEAETAVKTQLGYAPNEAVRLLEDYVAKAVTGNDYERIRQIAQVVARVIVTNTEALNTAANGITGVSSKALMQTAVADAAKQLQAIQVVADDANNFIGGVIKPNTVTSSATTTYSQGTVRTEIEKTQLATTTIKTDALVALRGGSISFWVQQRNGTTTTYQLERSTDTVNAAGTEVTSKDEVYIPEQDILTTAAWRLYTSNNITLVNGSWVADTSDTCTLQPQSDASVNYTCGIGNLGNVRISTLDLAGRKVVDHLEKPEFKAAFNASATFSASAKGLQFMFVRSADRYKIGVWDCAGGVGNCNQVWSGNSPITSLSSLLQVTNPDVINIGNSFYALNVIFSGVSKTGTAGESGTATFYTGSARTTLPIAGAWKVVNVGGQTLLLLTIPPAYKFLSSTDEAGESMFFAVESNVVRRGRLAHKDVPSTELSFNSDAALDVIKAFDVSKAAP